MTNPRTAVLLMVLVGSAPLCGQVEPEPQQTLERLRRDQDEILRKAQRLHELMQRLLQRYEREHKAEQVALLRQGLQHLEQAGLVQDVASIRDDLAAAALSDALRKETEVVQDLERLLDILLQRRSIENLDQQVQETTQMAATARELERKQADLQRRTAAAAERPANATERDLDQQLDQLAREQTAEAQANARAAGTRRPFLEHALQQVRDLLAQQDALEQRAERERKGDTAAERERQFAVGELLQRTRELSEQVRDQAQQAKLGADARTLTEALKGNDQNAVQQARDRLQADLATPPRQQQHDPAGGSKADPDWQDLRQALENAPAGTTPAERQELEQLAGRATALAQQKRALAQQQNQAGGDRLQADARHTAESLAAGKEPAKDSPAAAVRSAADALQTAAKAAGAGEDRKAQQDLQKAIRDLEAARQRLAEQDPSAAQRAGRMAAQADATEKELKNAPAAATEEQQAAAALDQAEQALRQAAAQLDPQQGAAPGEVRPQLQQSRSDLESARTTLEQALQGAAGEHKDDMARAADRQQELRRKAEETRQHLQQAQQQGGITESQAKAASAPMQRAQEAMQQAEQQLRDGQQASAGQQQQQAAQALREAQQALQQHRQPGAEQQQAMQALAGEQKQLEEDILRLAEEAKEHKNPEARRALEDAAEAAKKAQQALEQGQQQEAEQQQEEARQKLEEAAKQLEEERDRYLDLRQEELLFRMKDELQAFLDRQQPITAQTLELQPAAAQGNLSRPARRKLNQFAEEEQELAGKVQTLVQALQEEGNLVYRTVLQANHEDLTEVGRRLAGRQPDPGTYTTMLQQDVERRTKDLLGALEREQKRREQERQQRQQGQDQKGQNRFNPQRQKLVSLIAELEMLKQLEQDTARATDDLRTLVDLRGGDTINEAEVALVERLAHRHADVTRLFAQIKAGIDEALQAMQGQDDKPPQGGGKGR